MMPRLRCRQIVTSLVIDVPLGPKAIEASLRCVHIERRLENLHGITPADLAGFRILCAEPAENVQHAIRPVLVIDDGRGLDVAGPVHVQGDANRHPKFSSSHLLSPLLSNPCSIV